MSQQIAQYLRVSTDKQEIFHQKTKIADWCKVQGYGDVLTYTDEGISGATSKRPGFLKLQEDIKNGKIKKIITFEMSRLSRDFMTTLEFMELATNYGVEIEIPFEGVQNFASATDKLLVAVKGFVSAQFLEDHSRRVKSGIEAAKRSGKKFGGFREEARGWRKEYDPVLVKKIVTLHDIEKLSLRKISVIMSVSVRKVSTIYKRNKEAA